MTNPTPTGPTPEPGAAEFSVFLTCPKGLESLLAAEAAALGAASVGETVAGVRAEATKETLYRLCLWSRLANRVLLPLGEFPAGTADGLYDGLLGIDWPTLFAPSATFAIDFIGTNLEIRHSRFGAQKSKDAVVDRFIADGLARPDVDLQSANLKINVRIHRGRATVALDLSGDSLHRRGYRVATGEAPLKENLAAAVLLRAGWPEFMDEDAALLDPMCGSGTLLIEAAMMAFDVAPGLRRRNWGFTGWAKHDEALWADVEREAAERGAEAVDRPGPAIIGHDSDARAIASAVKNIAAAGLDARIHVSRKSIERLVKPTHRPFTRGLVVVNPPYGERLGDEAPLIHLHALLGQRLREGFGGWRAAMLTGNPALGRATGLRARRHYKLYNGRIESRLLLFELAAGDGDEADSVPALSAGAEQFANRLRKNAKRLARWRKREGVECYRLYDADMPEYAVAVDVYGGWVHVAEYRAPPGIEPAAAERRRRDVIMAVPAVLGVDPSRVILKRRERQRGSEQYQRQSQRGEFIEVPEGPARLLVNLRDYLDTGLFLDHRALRLGLPELVAGKRFLNLYCYTATATVQAALGGAASSKSVDLSSTYLDWAKRNFALNQIDPVQHRLERAECRSWLESSRQRFDVILLDPPTFSNSKRAEGSLDVQRDHGALIRLAMARLEPDGLLVFSTNRRKFALDPDLGDEFAIEDRTRWSLDPDVERGRSERRCWFIKNSRS